MGGKRLIAALLCLVCLSGCTGRSAAPALPCRVVLEEGEGFTCDGYARTVERGGSVEFHLVCEDGYEIVDVDCEGAVLRPAGTARSSSPCRTCATPPRSPSQ